MRVPLSASMAYRYPAASVKKAAMCFGSLVNARLRVLRLGPSALKRQYAQPLLASSEYTEPDVSLVNSRPPAITGCPLRLPETAMAHFSFSRGTCAAVMPGGGW